MSHDHHSTAEAKSRLGRPRRTVAMAAAALTLGMGALSLAAVPAAQAAPAGIGAQAAAVQATAVPCTVTALKPYFSGKFTVSGKKLVVYPIGIKCTKGGVKVHIQQKLMEADPGTDETQRGWATVPGSPVPFHAAGTKTLKPEYRLTNMDWFGNEEVYHVVRFRVESIGTGVFTPWFTVQSPERSISA